MTIAIALPDGNWLELEEGATVLDAAEKIGPRLAQAAVAGRVNGKDADLSEKVADGDHVEITTRTSPEGVEILRHSTAHVMAEAVGRLIPGAKYGIGPSIENGFYYDFEVDRPFAPEDLEKIDAVMRDIAASKEPFVRREVTRDQALFDFADQPYKKELIEELPEGETISVYTQGDFTDLCRGPHVGTTDRLGAFKLLSIAGAYWRGDAKRPMLQRIYGTAWPTQKELDEYLEQVEEAERRDHRKIGRDLDLFSFDEKVGAGLVLYHPKGATILHILRQWELEEHVKRGYEPAITPHIYKADVWKTSGHYDFYRDNMYFFRIEGEGAEAGGAEYALKPMNCPGHVLIYRSATRSYRDLPIRMFEHGTVYRHELSGVVHGLMRARGFTQDDAHIFCMPDQVKPEVKGVLAFTLDVYRQFGFSEFEMEVSTRPEKSIGEDQAWEHATESLKESLEESGLPYAINEGDGAFYGPKIDVKLKDAIGRTWQCATIQVDFNFPERFDLTYMTAENKHERPYMIHRTILGSMERFFGILIEHFAGNFPVWLAPVQAAVIPIAERHEAYAGEAATALRDAGLRVDLYDASENLNAKIRKAQLEKIPYMLVVGDREAEKRAVAVRMRSGEDRGAIALDEVTAEITEKARTRALD
jgi:threonyl-tRNA synthetase